MPGLNSSREAFFIVVYLSVEVHLHRTRFPLNFKLNWTLNLLVTIYMYCSHESIPLKNKQEKKCSSIMTSYRTSSQNENVTENYNHNLSIKQLLEVFMSRMILGMILYHIKV